MNSTFRNLVGVVAGVVVTLMVNGGLISISGSIVPPPPGVDPTDVESLRGNIDLFEARHFLFPFLAHALGSLAGGFVCATLAATRKMALALLVGTLHLMGGIAAAMMIPAPVWFVVVDLTMSYLPMAWLGGKLARA